MKNFPRSSNARGDGLHLCNLLPLGSHELTEVDDPLGIAPLVIVPGNNLDHVITHDHGERRVDDCRFVGTAVVARHQRLIRVLDNALHLTFGRLEEGTVDLLLKGLLADLHDDIAHRHVGGGDTEGDTVELAGEAGDN